MSKFTRSLALQGNDLHASVAVPQAPKTTPVAPTGSLNVDGGGGGWPSSAYGPAYGQQQNGAGGQQPWKPSTANPSSYGGKGPEHHTSAEKDNEREVTDHDNNQKIQSPSMSTQSQRGKVLPRSKAEERTSAPADPPASGSHQYSTHQGGLDGTVVSYIVVPNKHAYEELQSQYASKESKPTAGVQHDELPKGYDRVPYKPLGGIDGTEGAAEAVEPWGPHPPYKELKSPDCCSKIRDCDCSKIRDCCSIL